jgi:hypothetical protein
MQKRKAFFNSQKQFVTFLFYLDQWQATYKVYMAGNDEMDVNIDPVIKNKVEKEKLPQHMRRAKFNKKKDTPDNEFNQLQMSDSPKDWDKENVFYVKTYYQLNKEEIDEELDEFQQGIISAFNSGEYIFCYIHRFKDPIKVRQGKMKELTGTSFEDMMKDLELEKKR